MTLKELVLSNPDLPVIIQVFNRYDGEYEAVSLYTNPEAVIGEFFDHKKLHDFDDNPFTNREDLADAIREESDFELTEAELNAKLAEYESFWKPCILVEL